MADKPRTYCAKCSTDYGLGDLLGARDCPSGGKHQWVDLHRARNEDGVWFSIHPHISEGLLTGKSISAGKKDLSWKAYRVYLTDVDKHFGSHWQPYNKKYDAAVKIFESLLTGPPTRAMLYAEHVLIFDDSNGDVTTGRLCNAKDFLQKFDFGMVCGARSVFTYVILADRLHFVETGIGRKDLLSKHALLSKASREVRYSGEMHVRPVGETGHVLVMDNNSGTYAPDKAMLPALRAVMKATFPDLEVEVYDRQDPALKASIEAMKAN